MSTDREIVFDRWWPWRMGEVVRRFKRGSVWVRWSDGEVWKYDRAHAQFLERA